MMSLAEMLSKKDQEDLIRYMRLLAANFHYAPGLSPSDFVVQVEREAIVLMNGAPLIDDPDGNKPAAASAHMGGLILRARDASLDEWSAIAKNALRLYCTGERPERWTVHP